MRLSPHTAPIRQTRRSSLSGLSVAFIASSRFQLSRESNHLIRSLLRPHYSAIIAPTDRSAPHRYSRLVGVAIWASPLTSERLVPAVPHESRLHAPFTPVAACPVIRLPAGLSREMVSLPVLTTILSLTTRLRRVHFRSSLRHTPAQGISLNFSSNAHHHGS